MTGPEGSGGFLTLDELSDELNISHTQAYAPVAAGYHHRHNSRGRVEVAAVPSTLSTEVHRLRMAGGQVMGTRSSLTFA